MKIVTQKEIFPDDSLRSIITAGQLENPDIPEAEFATNLLAINEQQKREEYIIQYVSFLIQQSGKPHEKTCKRLIDKLQIALSDFAESHSEAVTKRVNEAFLTLWPDLQNNVAIPTENLGKFPEYTVQLAEFEKLSQDKEKLTKMRKELDRHCKQDQKIEELKKIRHRKKQEKDFNRFHDSELQLEGGQKMIVVGITRRSLNEVSQYWQMIAETEAALMITLNSKGQWDQAHAFWSKKVLKEANCPVIQKSRESLFKDDKVIEDKIGGKPKEVQLQVIKRAFAVGEKQHAATHLQVKHWPDHQCCPTLEALKILTRERKALVTEKKTPIVINCQGGVGRTGEIALIIACEDAIESQVAQGVAKEKITLNIPEIMYQMRRLQPQLFGGSIEQLQQVCAYLADFA